MLIKIPLGKRYSKELQSIYENYYDIDESKEFLCKLNDFHYVVELRLLDDPDRTMPANIVVDGKTEDCCLYVDPPGGRECIPIDKLQELYLIDPS